VPTLVALVAVVVLASVLVLAGVLLLSPTPTSVLRLRELFVVLVKFVVLEVVYVVFEVVLVDVVVVVVANTTIDTATKGAADDCTSVTLTPASAIADLNAIAWVDVPLANAVAFFTIACVDSPGGTAMV
jgi:hypothetical protein